MEHINKFVDLGLNLSKRNEQRIVCPNCIERGVSNPKDKCLAVNLSKMVYSCHKCGDYKGIIIENEPTQSPVTDLKPYDSYDLSKKGLDFFKSRGISINTLKRFKVTADEKSINFNFHKGGKLINIKKRYPSKKFSLEPGAEITFYNYDDINSELLVITEGEIDALSIYEAMPNVPVVSLPNGANSLKFLDDCISELEDIDEIVIATDGDDQGKKAKDNLLVRFGTHRTSYVEYPKGCKDFNEVLLNQGAEGVKKCFDSRMMLPIKAVNSAMSHEETVKGFIKNGYPEGLWTDAPEIDSKIQLMLGEFVVISGTPGSGKTTVLDFLSSLHCKSLRNNIRVCVMSAEQNVAIQITKILCHYMERDIVKSNLSEEEYSSFMKFVNDNYVFINTTEMEKMNYKDVVQKMKEVSKRYGCNYFIIDPYNYIERDSTDHTSHAPALRAFANFAKMYHSLVALVAHPRKMEKTEDGNYKIVTPYEISGSADFFNIADTILSFWRDFNSNQNFMYVQKVRNEWLGSAPNEIEFRYLKEKKTFEVVRDSPY